MEAVNDPYQGCSLKYVPETKLPKKKYYRSSHTGFPATGNSGRAVGCIGACLTGSYSTHTLAERVASELYREELRNGAGVLNIGLFGSRFSPVTLFESSKQGMESCGNK